MNISDEENKNSEDIEKNDKIVLDDVANAELKVETKIIQDDENAQLNQPEELALYNEKKHIIKNKKLRIALIISLVLALNIVILCCLIACINKFNTNVYKNVFLFGNDMTAMTSDEIIAFLKLKSSDIKSNEKVNMFQGEENIYTIRADDFSFDLDIVKTAQNVMDFGRTGNILNDNINIIKTLFNPYIVSPVYKYNDEELQAILQNIEITIKDRFVDDTYKLDEKGHKLLIIKGKSGNTIDYYTEKIHIVEALKNKKTEKLELCIIEKKPTMIDVNKVYSEVKRDAKDAYIDESVKPIKFVSEVVGHDFKVEELEATLNKEENKKEGSCVEFSLLVTEPKKKLADITYSLYIDKLGGYTTYFSPSLRARSNNLEIALRSMNGKILMPQEVFSYNATIGDTSVAKGYQPASTFVGGREVMDIGGGICQTVSTLYNTVLLSNLQIVERHNHGLPVSYVPPSRDATVYSPVLDFKFKNNRNYPIKIVTSFSWGGNLNVSIFGTKEENDCEVILSHKLLRYIPFDTTYTYDANIDKGVQTVLNKGYQGYSSEGYITKKQNGVTTTKMLSRDTYNPQKQVVKIGTKENVPAQVE
ncbi:MAG: VanW family protein [Clostridia bacterium]